MKEKIRFYPEKGLVMICGTEWNLQLRRVRVKTKDNETMFVVKPLELHYNPEKHTFYYTELKAPIWLNKKQLDQLITTLIQLTEETEKPK